MNTRYLPHLMATLLVACASSNADSRAPAPGGATRVTLAGGDAGGRTRLSGGSVSLSDDSRGSERFIPAHPDSVWAALPEVYEKLRIEEAGADPAARTFGRMGFRTRRIEGKRLSSYLDCGSGPTAVPNADSYEVTITLLTRVTPADEGGTVVATTLSATARSREVNTNPVSCQSKGVLEMRLEELIMLALLPDQA